MFFPGVWPHSLGWMSTGLESCFWLIHEWPVFHWAIDVARRDEWRFKNAALPMGEISFSLCHPFYQMSLESIPFFGCHMSRCGAFLSLRGKLVQ